MKSHFRVGDLQVDVDAKENFEFIANGLDTATGRLGRIHVPLSRHQVETLVEQLMSVLDAIYWEEEGAQQDSKVEPAPEGGPDGRDSEGFEGM